MLAASSTPRLPRPHGCATTLTPPAARTKAIISSNGAAYRSTNGLEEPLEGLGAICDHPRRDQRVGHVGTTSRRRLARSTPYVVFGDLDAQVAQLGADLRNTLIPSVQDSPELGYQGRMGGVQEIRQQVHAAVLMGRTDLHPRHDL